MEGLEDLMKAFDEGAWNTEESAPPFPDQWAGGNPGEKSERKPPLFLYPQPPGAPLLGCFMQLKLPQVKEWDKLRGMRGSFRIYEDMVFFDARLDARETAALRCFDYAQVMLPLLRYLSEKEYRVDILGKPAAGAFHADGLHIVSGKPDRRQFTSPPFYLSDDCCQVMLRRLLELPADRERPAAPAPAPLFSSPGELSAVYGACRAAYPPGIRQWAENSFAALSTDHLGSTDKRHIHKALSYILNVDWSPFPLDVPDAETVREALDQQFYGLESVKQRIMEVAAQIRRSRSLPKWGILLNGPAGVGKTSITNAISTILGLPKAYLEFSVLRDSEALTGSSRIYDNGKPGLIMEQIYAHRTASLVMVLNEIDKAASGKGRGNPLDILLPLLDGMGFTDTYIEATIPTDGIFFVATCNDPDKISKPVLDRFYRIDIPAYGPEEKAAILDRFVLPRALRRAQVDRRELSLSEEGKNCLLTQYAVEPGVRDLEQCAEKLISNYLLRKETEGLSGVTYSADGIRALLGPAQVLSRNLCMFPGMAISAFSREGSVSVVHVQALLRPGNGKLELINVGGEHQREYCRIAYECVNLITGNRLRSADVVLGAIDRLPDTADNFIGCAACAAIFSAIKQAPCSSEELFLGGCDLFGNMYLDETTVDPYVRRLAGRFHTLYGPMGMTKLLYGSPASESMRLVELPNMSVLFELMDSKDSSSFH